MSALLIKVAVIISVVLGSSGGAVALATDSLPGSVLYPAKLAMEEVRLDAAADPAGQVAMYMTLVQERVREMQQMALRGEAPDEATMLRLRTHLEQAMRLAAGLPAGDLEATLNQARQMIQDQEREMLQTQSQTGEAVQERLRQATRLLAQAREQVEAGLQEPQAFRWQYGNGPQPEEPAGPNGPNNPDCPSGNCEPEGDQHQYGPGPVANPDCPDGTCEPEGDQYQYQHQYGPQPEEAGGPNGPADPDCPSCNCEPEGEQNQCGPGPQANPDCPSGNCEPEGEQHQHEYGPQPEEAGPDEPGGPGEPGGPCENCEPEGEQNQNQEQHSAGDPAGPGGPSGKKP